jgi:5-methylcytosine-specific restriction endonuclease McrA
MGMKRHGHAIYRSPRWAVLRLEAKRRDQWRCTECKAVGRLEVHHMKRVKDHPELAYDLKNLTTLCGRCHARITRIENGYAPLDPKRLAWRDLLAAMATHPLDGELKCLKV